MKTDPNKACTVPRERLPWAMLHDLIAHPAMALTLYSTISRRLHDFTSAKAWPASDRAARIRQPRKYRQTTPFGRLIATEEKPYTDDGKGFWRVVHPGTGHAVVSYGMPHEVMARALEEFREWWNLFGDQFAPLPADAAMYARLRAMDEQWRNLSI